MTLVYGCSPQAVAAASDQGIIAARMPFIRAAHTEGADGTCGICDVVWPCDLGTVLMALAAQTARLEAVTAARDIIGGHMRDWHDDQHPGSWQRCGRNECTEARYFLAAGHGSQERPDQSG